MDCMEGRPVTTLNPCHLRRRWAGRACGMLPAWALILVLPQMLLVMDYMEGGPVMTREALERGRCIPEPLALQYFRDMCKARTLPSTPARAGCQKTNKPQRVEGKAHLPVPWPASHTSRGLLQLLGAPQDAGGSSPWREAARRRSGSRSQATWTGAAGCAGCPAGGRTVAGSEGLRLLARRCERRTRSACPPGSPRDCCQRLTCWRGHCVDRWLGRLQLSQGAAGPQAERAPCSQRRARHPSPLIARPCGSDNCHVPIRVLPRSGTTQR